MIHHWDDIDKHPTFSGTVSWLCNPKSQVSAHYVVEAGRVDRIVDVKDAAWHTGDYWYNTHSIGIECRPEMSDEDLKTVIELVCNVWVKYGKMPIIGHRDVVATTCPGRYYDKLGYIEKEATKLYNKKKDQDQKPAKLKVDGELGPKTIKALQWVLRRKKLYSGPVCGDLGKNTVKGLQKFLNKELEK